MKNRHEILIYYFAFPHYRAAVLNELKSQMGDKLDLYSGSQSRSGLKPLNSQTFQDLNVVPTVRMGPFTWEKRIVCPAISKKYAAVVLGPAISSISTWVILIARWALRRKTYLWGQCGKPGDRSPKRFAQEIMNRLASGLLVYGNIEVAGASEFGLSANKIFKVRNSVPLVPKPLSAERLEAKLESRLSEVSDTKALKLVYAGRVNADKRLDILLAAGEILKLKYQNLTIRIIGDGPDKQILREQYPDDRYEFLGATYDREVLQRELESATFVVSPSTMGLLALDALSVGTPVMIPNNPRNGSEVEALNVGVNGFYFNYEDAKSLANQVEASLKLLANVDHRRYFESRNSGIHDWTAAAVASKILDVIG